MQRLEAEFLADLLEGDLVVARILVALDVAHLAAPEPVGDQLDEVELAVVLVGVPGVEDRRPPPARRRREHQRDARGRVAHVHVRAPELLAEDLERPRRPRGRA